MITKYRFNNLWIEFKANYWRACSFDSATASCLIK